MPSSALVTWVLACVLAWAAPGAARAADPPLIEYTVVHHMPAEADPQPLLRVWSDGRVHAFFPVYVTRAGDYELKLSETDLLLGALEATGLFAADLDAARGTLEARDGSLHHVSDVTETVIRVRLTATGRTPGLATTRPVVSARGLATGGSLVPLSGRGTGRRTEVIPEVRRRILSAGASHPVGSVRRRGVRPVPATVSRRFRALGGRREVHLPGRVPVAKDRASHTGPPSAGSSLARRRRWSPERLSLVVSIALATCYNFAFWTELTALLPPTVNGALFALSVFVVLIALTWLLLGFLAVGPLHKPVLVLLLCVTALTAYFSDVLGTMIDPVMLQNIAETDVLEASELITPGLLVYLALLGLLPSWLVWRTPTIRRRWPAALAGRAGSIALALLVIVVAVVPFYRDYAFVFPDHRELRYLAAPPNSIYSAWRYARAAWRAADLPLERIGEDAHLIGPAAGSGRKSLLILVVGETARAQEFALNGYSRSTNPVLADERIVSFDDVSACGTSTAVSVPCMFSSLGQDGFTGASAAHIESLLDVLAHAGLGVEWRDNNSGCKGVCDRVLSRNSRDLWDDRYCGDRRCLDDVLMGQLAEDIAELGDHAVVVLHQLGSHGPAYSSRYPDEYRRFEPDCTGAIESCTQEELVNAYDNTILYTDHFLGEVIDFLRSLSAEYDTAMLYVSDHGESLGENGLYLHGLPYALAPVTQTHVPLVVWLSEELQDTTGIDVDCLAARRHEPLSHDHLFHSVLGLTNVDTDLYDERLDLFAACRAPGPEPSASTVAAAIGSGS